MRFLRIISTVIHYCHFRGIKRLLDHLEILWIKQHFGYLGNSVYLGKPNYCLYPQKIYLYDNCSINPGSTFILFPDPQKENGRFIMKDGSFAAQNLTIINHNHTSSPRIGIPFKQQTSNHIGDIIKDVIIEEGVWVGANVTLLAGVVVGRGSIIGTNSVLRKSVPPYSIVTGNPAKIIGFVFTPEEAIQHEKMLYSEDIRYSYEELQRNYDKHFLKRIKEIKEFTKI